MERVTLQEQRLPSSPSWVKNWETQRGCKGTALSISALEEERERRTSIGGARLGTQSP